jgi:hypothetical protein
MASLIHIARHWANQTEKGRGIRIEADALDLLNEHGVGEFIMRLSAEQQRNQCQERNRSRNRFISEANSASSDVPAEPTSKSSGTMPPQSGTEALQRVQRMLNAGKRR